MNKNKREVKEIVLFDGWEYYEAYKEDGEPDDVAWNLVCEDYDNILRELGELFNEEKVLLAVDIGRWNGRWKGYGVDTISDLMDRFTRDCDLMYTRITDVGGHLYIKASHHDSTNYGEVKVINDKGRRYWENYQSYSFDPWDRSDSHVMEVIDRNYSTLPRAAKKLGFRTVV